jgi:hypothetical protein
MSLDNVLPMSLESFVTYVPERFIGAGMSGDGYSFVRKSQVTLRLFSWRRAFVAPILGVTDDFVVP